MDIWSISAWEQLKENNKEDRFCKNYAKKKTVQLSNTCKS